MQEEIEKRYSPNIIQGRVSYGDIIRVTDHVRYSLRSASLIISALVVDDRRLLDELEKLTLQLETGCPEDALELVELPVPLTRGELLALRGAGLRTIEHVWKLPLEELARIIGKTTAEKLQKVRPTTAN